jgi:hypothetical protein
VLESFRFLAEELPYPELCTIYDYMRAHAALLGERILQEYPALHQFDDLVSPRIQELLRKPFPAQTIAIMGTAKRWQRARTAMVVAGGVSHFAGPSRVSDR